MLFTEETKKLFSLNKRGGRDKALQPEMDVDDKTADLTAGAGAEKWSQPAGSQTTQRLPGDLFVIGPRLCRVRHRPPNVPLLYTESDRCKFSSTCEDSPLFFLNVFAVYILCGNIRVLIASIEVVLFVRLFYFLFPSEML